MRYSNSGLYLLYADPRKSPDGLDEAQDDAYREAFERAAERSALFGPGPFELDFFSREVQIIAGTDSSIPPENFGAGALYGTPLGLGEGFQDKTTDYELFPGDSYRLTLVHDAGSLTTYLQSLSSQSQAVQVTSYQNVSREQDALRGSSPVALLLQAFYQNGRDVQLPKFSRLELIQHED